MSENTPKDSSEDAIAPDGTTPGGTTPGGTTPDGTTPGGTAPGGTAPGGTAPGGTTPGGTTPGGAVAINLNDAAEEKPSENVQKSGETISGLQRAGVELAKWVLIIISGALATLTVLVASSELWPTSEVTSMHTLVLEIHKQTSSLPADDPKLPAARKDLQEITRQIADAKQSERAFWMQFSQMILLNLLLPVLTAILGYVFGANNSKT